MAIALVVAAALGGAGGLVAGFVAAVITLAARRGRNARLVARGEAPYKDAILPRAFIGFGAVAGAIVSPLAALCCRPRPPSPSARRRSQRCSSWSPSSSRSRAERQRETKVGPSTGMPICWMAQMS
jgi:hypothetical protein